MLNGRLVVQKATEGAFYLAWALAQWRLVWRGVANLRYFGEHPDAVQLRNAWIEAIPFGEARSTQAAWLLFSVVPAVLLYANGPRKAKGRVLAFLAASLFVPLVAPSYPFASMGRIWVEVLVPCGIALIALGFLAWTAFRRPEECEAL